MSRNNQGILHQKKLRESIAGIFKDYMLSSSSVPGIALVVLFLATSSSIQQPIYSQSESFML